MEKRQLSIGLVLSYLLIIVNSFYGLLITPFIIKQIGVGDYGVYKAVASFSASLAVVDLGLGSTAMRYISYFRATKEKRKIENYSAMALGQGLLIILVLFMIGRICYSFIPDVFSAKFSADELIQAENLFTVLIINMGFNIIENVLFGIICGSNEFIFANSVKLARILIRIVLLYIFLMVFKTSLTLVLIDGAIVLLAIVIESFFIIRKLGILPQLHYFDKPIFFESLKYSLLLFAQSVVVQFNGNIDNIIIGAYIGASAVSVYSIGLQLYNMFEQFATSFSNLMLPSVTNQVVNKADNHELENTVIKVGRFQFIFLGAVLSGFLILGKEFIILWVGNDFTDAWLIGLILMIPTIIPLVQNVCLSILRAKNKLGFRTVVVSAMAVVNFIITFLGVKYFGYIMAAVGTAVSLILANVIGMNIYYSKVLKLNILRIFQGICSRIWICILLCTIFIGYLKNIAPGGLTGFVLLVIAYVSIYAVLILFIGLNTEERKMIGGIKRH